MFIPIVGDGVEASPVASDGANENDDSTSSGPSTVGLELSTLGVIAYPPSITDPTEEDVSTEAGDNTKGPEGASMTVGPEVPASEVAVNEEMPSTNVVGVLASEVAAEGVTVTLPKINVGLVADVSAVAATGEM